MTTIAVLSDTHGNADAIELISKTLCVCDYVVHLGDCFTDMSPLSRELGDKLICVRGNCDVCSATKTHLLEVEGKRLFFTHGDAFRVKEGVLDLYFFAKENKIDAVFYGHTHHRKIDREGGILIANPGALERNSFDKSFMIVTVTREDILCNIHCV